MDELRKQLNAILAKKGKKHRKYTKKELKQLYIEYGDRADEVIANTFIMDVPEVASQSADGVDLIDATYEGGSQDI